MINAPALLPSPWSAPASLSGGAGEPEPSTAGVCAISVGAPPGETVVVGAGSIVAAAVRAAPAVPVAEGKGIGGSAPVERSRRLGPAFQRDCCTAGTPATVKVI